MGSKKKKKGVNIYRSTYYPCFLVLFISRYPRNEVDKGRHLSLMTVSKALAHYCFLVFRRIGEYISLDLFYFVKQLFTHSS